MAEQDRLTTSNSALSCQDLSLCCVTGNEMSLCAVSRGMKCLSVLCHGE